jgi:hypothetical protein
MASAQIVCGAERATGGEVKAGRRVIPEGMARRSNAETDARGRSARCITSVEVI